MKICWWSLFYGHDWTDWVPSYAMRSHVSIETRQCRICLKIQEREAKTKRELPAIP